MVEVNLMDLKDLYFASFCQCSECTTDCEPEECCNLYRTQQTIKKILNLNGISTNID